MTARDAIDPASLAHLLPADRVGDVRGVQPIVVGQSGAAVYAVTTSRGEYVLRVHGTIVDPSFWAQHLLIQRRAAESGVAPAIVHVDEAARAVVALRVLGAPLAAALGDPAQRERALANVVEKLRLLHGLETSGVRDRDPLVHARAAYEAQRRRDGYPTWAAPDAVFDRVESALAGDRRRVVAHNDVNPTNVLWDGREAWLIDWDVAGLAHPHYDLAVLATFLLLGDEAAQGWLAMHDRAPPDVAARATFATLRRLAGLISGLAFLSLVPDLAVLGAPTLADAPTLAGCYAQLRAGALDMQTARGRASFALALLRTATEL
jgi:aminoglycoside phosphotransferase (APT) family kinase protein